MTSRNLFASIPMACLLAVGFLGIAPVANAASVGLPFLDSGKSAVNNVIKTKNRARGPRIYLPIVPYIAYDYPYYYSRGFYPTHIGPGFVYFGYPYKGSYSPRYGSLCAHWPGRCVADRGNYRGPVSPRRQKARGY